MPGFPFPFLIDEELAKDLPHSEEFDPSTAMVDKREHPYAQLSTLKNYLFEIANGSENAQLPVQIAGLVHSAIDQAEGAEPGEYNEQLLKGLGLVSGTPDNWQREGKWGAFLALQEDRGMKPAAARRKLKALIEKHNPDAPIPGRTAMEGALDRYKAARREYEELTRRLSEEAG